MSEGKRLRECSLEELQEEMKRRRVEETNASTSLAVGKTRLEMGVKTARQILSDHCFVDKKARESSGEKFPVDLALFLLRKYPELMWEPFNKGSVFSYFILAEAPLSVMKELCLLWKTQAPPSEEAMDELWKDSFSCSPNPIADFCNIGRSNIEVFKFLVAEFPDHLEACQNRDEHTPIDFLLNRCDSIRHYYSFMEPEPDFLVTKQMFETLMEHCSKDFLSSFGDTDSWVHEGALSGRFGTALSPFLFKALVEHGELDALGFYEGSWELSSLLSAAAVFPRMKSFELDPDSVEVEAFTATMNYIHCCPNGACLEKLTMPILHESLNQEGKDLVVAALQSCRFLKKLTLVLLGADTASTQAGEALCLISKDIVGANLGITTLTLKRFCLDNGAPLSDLLPVVARSVVKFHAECSIKNDGACTSSPVGHSSKLESLSLQCTSFRIGWAKAFLKQLKGLPSLRALTLHGPAGPGVSNAILAILALNRLQKLILCRVEICWDPFIEALKQNTSLKWLEASHAFPEGPSNSTEGTTEGTTGSKKLLNLLRDHNTSLEHTDLYPHRDFENDIHYYTSMNRHGRGKLTAPGAKKYALVQALCSVLENENLNKGRLTVTAQQLQYGLLRESPAAWAAN